MAQKIKIERPVIERPVIERSKVKRSPVDRPKIAPKGMMWPEFDTLFEPDNENPLDALSDTGDVEGNVNQELDVTLDALLADKKGKNDAYRVANDDEFWFAVCFQSRAQKDDFLRLAGWDVLKDDKYIDGLALARLLRVAVEAIPMPKPKITGISKKGGVQNG